MISNTHIYLRSFKQYHFALATLVFLVFVIYGSLIPFEYNGRTLSEGIDTFMQIRYLSLGIGSRADWVANILLYIPLSFFLSAWISTSRKTRLSTKYYFLIFTLCLTLAIAIEFLQVFFPPRTVSFNDLIAESLGTLIGICLWVAGRNPITKLWSQFSRGGNSAITSAMILYVIAYLVLSLFPYDFLISFGELKEKWALGRYGLFLAPNACEKPVWCIAKLGAEVIATIPLGAIAAVFLSCRTGKHYGRLIFLGAILAVLIESIQFFEASGVTQGVSIITRTTGILFGALVVLWATPDSLLRLKSMLRPAILLLILPYFFITAFLNGWFEQPWQSIDQAMNRFSDVRWLPFYFHYYSTETVAVISTLANITMYLPVGVGIWGWQVGGNKPTTGALARKVAVLAALYACVMEFGKLFIATKHPDLTNVLIAAVAGAAAYSILKWFSSHFSESIAPTKIDSGSSTSLGQRAYEATNGISTGRHRHRSTRRSPRRAGSRLIALTFGALPLAIAGVFFAMMLIPAGPIETYVDESRLPMLPPPNELPAASLPGFHYTHPRLPAPSYEDISVIQKNNPGYFRRHKQSARSGQGSFFSVILTALVEPTAVDLNVLHRRLMDLQFSWRGHQQAKPLALAYDWLYHQWSERQRTALRGKLSEGINYLIDFIRREQRLSPYNVYLYNSPFQALIAANLALYGDDPRANLAMNFTYDLWKNRVLPVWRQVMGQNGGWHEGGEYVGIGIGQAIYQVPAMWRKATGDDLFLSEPGIRGFLDFLVYRRRPDQTDFRWGDAGHFKNAVPDRIPLAIEYGHTPGYSLNGCPDRLAPTAWPWGPLLRPNLCQPKAKKSLPLARYFDGIGLIVARSSWEPDATYVTFKAGDNYWSHSHLDQGSFTIYKNGALAIDSGLYGPRYGSDHHMNYTYQTIAHNAIVVKDPADVTPAPPEPGKKPRNIANDGGQRRIGSGWGIEAAPLDLEEWNRKREIYETGNMKAIFMEDGLIAAIAELTPAYTNTLSGKNTFSNRTNRVKRFYRSFIFDTKLEAIVVFDQIQSIESGFPKRWLLHSINEPTIDGTQFLIQTAKTNENGEPSGQLEGKVLLPKDAYVYSIGGSGLEFLVDEKNYDENGKIIQLAKKDPSREPGAWRIEVSPESNRHDDSFLVVMLSRSDPARSEIEINELSSENNPIGVEINGQSRALRLWFNSDNSRILAEIAEDGKISTHVIAW